MPLRTISITKELQVRLKKHKHKFNVSGVCQTALSNRMRELDAMEVLREEQQRHLDEKPPRTGIGTFRPSFCYPDHGSWHVRKRKLEALANGKTY